MKDKEIVFSTEETSVVGSRKLKKPPHMQFDMSYEDCLKESKGQMLYQKIERLLDNCLVNDDCVLVVL